MQHAFLKQKSFDIAKKKDRPVYKWFVIHSL